jgi:hypothetical protein
MEAEDESESVGDGNASGLGGDVGGDGFASGELVDGEHVDCSSSPYPEPGGEGGAVMEAEDESESVGDGNASGLGGDVGGENVAAVSSSPRSGEEGGGGGGEHVDCPSSPYPEPGGE